MSIEVRDFIHDDFLLLGCQFRINRQRENQPCGKLRLRKVAFLVAERREARLQMERSEEHTSELQSQSNLVCRLLLEKKNNKRHSSASPQRCGSPNPSRESDALPYDFESFRAYTLP